MFGRRKSPPPAPPAPDQGGPGHSHVLALLDREEHEKPLQRVQLAGRVLFDLACQIVADGNGVRIENLLALLASTGGQQCIAPLLEQAHAEGKKPQDLGILVVETVDGRIYYFGDAPNALLIESQYALLSIALGAAQASGAAVTMDMVNEEMKQVASVVGAGDAFFLFDLPERNRIDSPANWAAHFTPKIVQACDLYRVPPLQRATAIGFALYRAIEAGKDAIDPTIAARIVLGCAVRCAKADPMFLESRRRAA